MAEEVKVPELGENIDKAEVAQVLVAKGDSVTAEQPLIEVESDKASVEIPAPFAGTVADIRVKTGQTIKIGQVILTLDKEGEGRAAKSEDSDDSDSAAEQEPAQAGKKESKSEAPQPEKSPEERAKEAAQKYDVSDRVGKVSKPDLGDPAPAAPSVRRFARELGVDVQRLKDQGSGPGGRITFDDIKGFVKNVVQRRDGGGGVSGPAPAAMELPDFEQYGNVRREHMSGIRRKIGEKMSMSWTTIPHVTQFDEADITALEEFRKAKAKIAEKRGAKLTVTAILLKVLAEALKRFPQFNASLDLRNDEIIYKEYIHIGVAVDTDRGLLVPVLRDVDTKSVIDLALELNDVAGRARDRKTKPDELQGGNISLTNLGGLGTTHFTPIINWPDVAVLGVGRAKIQPVYSKESGEFEPRQIMPLSISYDHRIIDGADAARFLRWICEVLEQPLTMLL